MLGMRRAIGMYLVCVLGCGGGGGSGVASSKKLSDITNAEAMSICDAHNGEVSDMAGCTAVAAVSTISKSDCQKQRDACIKELSGSTSDSCKNATAAQVKSCSGTVGALESCLDSVAKYYNDLSCDMAGKTGEPPSCIEKCPGPFGVASDSSDAGSSSGSADAGVSSGVSGSKGGSSGSSGSSGSTGSSGSGSTGTVGSSTQLRNLTSSQLVSLCQDNLSKLQAIADAGCTANGLPSSSKAECEASRDACLADNKNTTVVDCSSASTSDLVNCSATVGQFSDCLGTLSMYFMALSCDDYAKGPPAVPACFDSLSMSCPKLFSSM